MKKTVLAVVGVMALGAMLLPATVCAQTRIRLAHVVNERDGFHIAALRFKEIVETRTGGKITVDLFPNATLGDERTLLEGMQIGTIDMGVITNGPVANFLPEIAVFELPFLFANRRQAHDALDGPVGQDLLRRLEKVNLIGLAFAERGFRNLTNSQREVRTPADMKGLRIRVMENPVYIETFRILGANTIPMAWTEALTALQQRTIDGQENPIGVIHSFKLNETQKFLSLTRHTYAPAVFVMSARVFNKFPKAQQEIFVRAAQEASGHVRKFNEESEATQLAELRARGMVVTEPDVASFVERVAPVYAKYEKTFGDYLKRIRAGLK